MIKDKPYRFLRGFFIGLENFICRHFAKISFIGDVKPAQDKATLLLMNHFSFNDGAITHRFSRKIMHKNFKAMVIEEQMKSFFVLKYCGCFSVNKKSRTLVESLNYAASLLAYPQNMVTIFPQGEVFSSHLNQIKFEAGVGKVLQKKEKDLQIILAVTLIDYLDSFKPKANFYFEEYIGEENINSIEKAYNLFYKRCKIQQQKLHNPPVEVIDEV